MAERVTNHAVLVFEKTPAAEPNGLYRVQVGAFGVKENAERLAAELKAKGYATTIK